MHQMNPKNVLLIYVSLFNPRPNAGVLKPTQYQIEGSKGTVLGTQTNEAVLRFLARDKGNRPDRIIAICSESVCTKPCAAEGYTSTLDYLQNGVLPELNYAPDVLQVVAVPDRMDEPSRNQIIREVSQQLAPHDDLFIDLSGGMRDTAMLLVTIARYLQTILGVNTRGVYYAEMGTPPMLRKSTQLYDILEMISAVDLFFETGNITKLRNYLNWQDTDKHAKLLLAKIEAFSEDLALCQMVNIKKDLKDIAATLAKKDEFALDAFHQLLFELFSERFEQTFQNLLNNREESLPSLVAWCNEHQMYQQALTLISEQLPGFVCKHIFAQPTERGFAFLQSYVINHNQPWPYPLFHYHFNTLNRFNTFPSTNLQINKKERAAGARPISRIATDSEFSDFLHDVVARGFFEYDASAEAHLIKANRLYQQVLIYRNYISHASKLPDILESAGVPQLNIANITTLLNELYLCIQDIQSLKKVVPQGVTARKETELILAPGQN